MYCIKCGSEIPDNVKFCVKCGNPTSEEGQDIQTGNQQGTVIVKAGGGAFQKIILLIICAVFLVIMFIAVSFYFDSQKEKELAQQQNKIAAQNQKEQEKAQEEYETKMANYENHCGSWEIKRARIDGEWQDYNFWGQALGKVIDFRNLYAFGSETNYGGGTTIEFGTSSVDLNSIGFGVYDLDNFTFEFNKFGAPTFTNEEQGIQFRFIDDDNPPLVVITVWADDQWIDICTCERA